MWDLCDPVHRAAAAAAALFAGFPEGLPKRPQYYCWVRYHNNLFHSFFFRISSIFGALLFLNFGSQGSNALIFLYIYIFLLFIIFPLGLCLPDAIYSFLLWIQMSSLFTLCSGGILKKKRKLKQSKGIYCY